MNEVVAVRIRAPRAMAAARIVVAAVILAALVAMIRSLDVELGLGFMTGLFAVSGAYTVLGLVVGLFRPDGVDLRPDAAVVRGWFRTRTVAWHDVADVSLETWGVVLVLTDGRRIHLGYPSPGLLPPSTVRRMRADHTSIREWWLTHNTPAPTA